MKLAKVVGTVVLSQCIEPFRGQILHLTQDIDERLEPVGEAEVCATWAALREGDAVIVEVAARSLQCLRPSTACGRGHRRQGGRDTPRLSGTALGPSTAHSFQL